MRASVVVAGIVVLIIGLIVLGVAAAYTAGAAAYAVGAAIAVIGVIVIIVGLAISSPRVAQRAAPSSPSIARAAGTEAPAEVMESMVRMLAEAPEAQRREMMRARLSSFAAMEDDERANAMRMMMSSLQKLDAAAQRKITYTRLECLAEDFDSATRKKLISTHMSVLMGLPKEEALADLHAMVSAMGLCHDSCRMKLLGTMKELMMEMPQDKKTTVMQVLPADVQKMLMG